MKHSLFTHTHMHRSAEEERIGDERQAAAAPEIVDASLEAPVAAGADGAAAVDGVAKVESAFEGTDQGADKSGEGWVLKQLKDSARQAQAAYEAALEGGDAKIIIQATEARAAAEKRLENRILRKETPVTNRIEARGEQGVEKIAGATKAVRSFIGKYLGKATKATVGAVVVAWDTCTNGGSDLWHAADRIVIDQSTQAREGFERGWALAKEDLGKWVEKKQAASVEKKAAQIERSTKRMTMLTSIPSKLRGAFLGWRESANKTKIANLEKKLAAKRDKLTELEAADQANRVARIEDFRGIVTAKNEKKKQITTFWDRFTKPETVEELSLGGLVDEQPEEAIAA
jgi:hypothetical protein